MHSFFMGLLTEIQWAIDRASRFSFIDEKTKADFKRSSQIVAGIKKQFES